VSAGVKVRNVAGLSYTTSSAFIFSSSRRFWASNSAIAALVDTGSLVYLIAALWCRSKLALTPGAHQPPLVEHDAELAPDDPAVVRYTFAPHAREAVPALLPIGVGQLHAVAIGDAQDGGLRQESPGPTLGLIHTFDDGGW